MKVWKQLWSLVTDRQWDLDLTKVLGLVIVVAGIVGWFRNGSDPTVVLALGSALVASGKWSKEG